jgi:hypothetical protein
MFCCALPPMRMKCREKGGGSARDTNPKRKRGSLQPTWVRIYIPHESATVSSLSEECHQGMKRASRTPFEVALFPKLHSGLKGLSIQPSPKGWVLTKNNPAPVRGVHQARCATNPFSEGPPWGAVGRPFEGRTHSWPITQPFELGYQDVPFKHEIQLPSHKALRQNKLLNDNAKSFC